jgi:putative ABC transport system substrate-binding protein
MRAFAREPFRRRVLVSLALAPFAVRTTSAAARAIRVGYLELLSAPDGEDLYRAFMDGMKDRGYVQGLNLEVVRRSAGGRVERLLDQASDFTAGQVDVIFAASTAGARAAKHSAPKTPAVFVMGHDPVFEGLVGSLSRPGGKLTGLTTWAADLTGKRLQILKQAFPSIRVIAVVGSHVGLSRIALDASAAKLGLSAITFPVEEYRDYGHTAAEIARSAVDAVLVAEDADAIASIEWFVRLMMATRRPVMFNCAMFAERFGLMSYGVDLRERYRRAAGVVARVVGGANPGDIAVELPSRYELVVNLRAAEEYAIALPREFLLRADRVVQ